MNLDNVTAELRPRSQWEAADFGVRMVRRDAAAIYKVWFAVTIPLVIAAVSIIWFSPYPGLAVLIYWLLEPVLDGPILHIISRRLFGEKADAWATLRQVPALAWRNRIFWLTPYRFHFARSIAMPVTQLEGLSGQARRRRARVLNQIILNHGIGVTISYQHLWMAIYFGVVFLVFAFVPVQFQQSTGLDWLDQFWEESGRTASALNLLLLYVAQSVLQPWYVGAGFGLYINCRTQLEAWDIEVAFRRMVQRRATGVTATAIAVVIFASLSPALTPPASAEEATEYQDPGFSGFWEEEDIDPAIDQVMDDEALKRTTEVRSWRRTDAGEENVSPAGEGSDWWRKAIRAIGDFLSFVIEFGLWIGVAFAVLVVFLTRARWMPYLQMGSGVKARQARVLIAGGEITAESLPDDIPAEVMSLWRRGDQRAALSLLYRGSVFAAVIRDGVRLPKSATEGACVDAVTSQSEPARSGFFRKIVGTWTWCAYGGQVPADEAMAALCEEWPRHYGLAA